MAVKKRVLRKEETKANRKDDANKKTKETALNAEQNDKKEQIGRAHV